MLKLLIYIGTGSFLGGISRFLISKYFYHGSEFPYSTLLINIAGSLLIGLLFGISEKSHLLSQEIKLFFTIGFCGSFTTFSTLSLESFTMLKYGNYTQLAIYIGLSLIGGVTAVYLGYYSSKIF